MLYVNRIKEQEQIFCNGKKLTSFQKMMIYEVLKKTKQSQVLN